MAATSSTSFRTFSAATFSGIVSALGAGVTDFKVGDAVFGVTDQGIEGAYAEKIAVKAAIAAKKPPSLSHAEAAAARARQPSRRSRRSKTPRTSKRARQF
ncbi:MAG: hypothetical protein WDN48_03830 [Pseudolabrys sp.]